MQCHRVVLVRRLVVTVVVWRVFVGARSLLVAQAVSSLSLRARDCPIRRLERSGQDPAHPVHCSRHWMMEVWCYRLRTKCW